LFSVAHVGISITVISLLSGIAGAYGIDWYHIFIAAISVTI
jgi:hypothetical protein